MPSTTSDVPTSIEGPSPRPTRRGDAIIWRAFAAVALPLSILYFFLGDEGQTIIYQVFSVGALVGTVVGIRRYRPAPSHHWWLFAVALSMWCLGDAYWDCYRWILKAQAPWPSFADLAFFLGYPFFIAGLLTLARGWSRPRV